MSQKITRGWVRSVLAAALGAGAIASAQAAVYTGTWDPLYGPPFGGMSWKGSATFEFTGGCLVANGSVAGGCGGTFGVLSASVTFFDGTNPSIATLNWTNPATSLVSATFAAGQLTSVDTGYLGLPGDGIPAAGQETAATAYGLNGYSFFLDFQTAGAQLTHVWQYWPLGMPNPADCLATKSLVDSGFCGLSGTDDLPVGLRFARLADPEPSIPEPASYALMLAALAGAGWAARRRTSR